MQVIVISESLIIRKGIVEILSKESCVDTIKESHRYTDIYKDEYDLLVIDLNKNNKQYLHDIEKLKKEKNIKVMVLDFYEDRVLFSKCMKIGIDGYILANIESEDIAYIQSFVFGNMVQIKEQAFQLLPARSHQIHWYYSLSPYNAAPMAVQNSECSGTM